MKNNKTSGFTLVEVAVSIFILGVIISTSMVLLDRYMNSAANADLKLKAFEVARENMENLLAVKEVTDYTDFGTSEKYAEIEYETNVESFYEPLTSRMWIRAVCSASYIDTEDEKQTVELTNWLTDVSKQQLIQIMDQKKRQKEYEEELAEMEGEEWDDETPYEDELNGESSEELDNESPDDETNPPDDDAGQGSGDSGRTICGYTIEQLNTMSFDQVWKILMNCDDF